VHAQHGGFPLLGDPKYGDARRDASWQDAGVRRLCLHARSLEFRHPDHGGFLQLDAPLDDAMNRALTMARETEPT
jgi:23S rRNA pseudouridine955/2504/2580 synthase